MSEALDTGLLPSRRAPVVLQSESAECGLACAVMVLGAWGRDVPLHEMRAANPVSNRGLSLADLQEVLTSEGLNVTLYEASADEIEALRLPAILHWEGNHYVVLTEMKFGHHVRINDPAVGQRKLDWSEFKQMYTGYVAEVSPGISFKKQSSKNSGSAWTVLSSVSSFKPTMLKLFMLALFLEIAMLVSPLFLQTVVDEVLPVSDSKLLFTVAFGFVCVTLIKAASRIARDWMSMALSAMVNAMFKRTVFAHMLQLPLQWFDKRGLGVIQTRFASLGQIQNIISDGLVSMLISALLALVMMGVMLIYSPKLAFVTLVVAGLTLSATLFAQGAFTRANNELIHASGKEQSVLLEVISGISAVKFFGKETQQQRVFEAAMMHAENRNLDTVRIKTLHGATTFTLQALEDIVVVALAAYMVIGGTLTVGAMFGFYAYKSIFSEKMTGVADALMQLRLLKLHAETVGDITLASKEPKSKGALRVAAKPSLRVDGLTFRYPGSDDYLFKGLSFEVGPGEILGLTGPSGQGKSTLLKLLTGALLPESGAIYVDNIDITKLPPRDFRTLMSVVVQNDSVFTGTLLENITMFDPNPDMRRVLEATIAASIHEDIMRMPMQYQMHIFAGSPSLSGGQLQRLHLARAFYKNAPLLILDEATSHLDETREREVAQAIRTRGLTTIVVAHRKETLAGCDRVLRMGD